MAKKGEKRENTDEEEKADIEKRINNYLAMTMLKLTDCSITERRRSGIHTHKKRRLLLLLRLLL